MIETYFQLDGKNYKLKIDCPSYIYNGYLSDIGKNYIKTVIGLIDAALILCSEAILKIYNDSWSDDENPMLTKEEFLKKIAFEEIEILDEPDYAIIYFSDGGLFSGHTIAVTVVGDVLDGVDLL